MDTPTLGATPASPDPGARPQLPAAAAARITGRLGADEGKLRRHVAAVLGIGAFFAWAHWATLRPLIRDLWNDPNYSVGLLVPVAAAYLVWQERHRLARCRVDPFWGGILLIAAAQALRLYGLITLRESLDRYGTVLTVPGLVLLIGGKQVFGRLLWVLLFLLLMVPLPASVHNLIAAPLQAQAVAGADFVLELLGVVVVREGSVITLSHGQQVNVEEACSGLRMLTAFVVVACVLAWMVDRPLWHKAILAASSIPVAIVCNLVRLVVTSLLFIIASTAWAEWFFHEAGGWAMMVLAVFMLLGESWLLSRLFIEEPRERVSASL